MIGILRHQHMRQQPRPGKSAIDRPRRCRRLHDAVAGIAAQLRPHVAKHLEAGPHVLQHLGHIFAQFTETAAAVGAGVMTRHMGVNLARKMLRQGPATRLRRCGPLCGSCGLSLFDSACSLQVFELELQLLDLAQHLLALRGRTASGSASRPAASSRSISPARELERVYAAVSLA